MGKFDGGVADLQDAVFDKLIHQKAVPKKERKRIQNNIWIDYAYHWAPSNLVVRHLCLRDLLSGKPNNDYRIWSQMMILIQRCPNPIWVEGYSYWLYTKPFLKFYTDIFPAETACIGHVIEGIDENFALSGYRTFSGELYPAPFGDLRKVPLENHLQNVEPAPDFCCPVFTKNRGNRYDIHPLYLGFNAHVPVNELSCVIIAGKPFVNGNEEFTWYEGWGSKYDSTWDEIKDYLNPKRIYSAISQTYKKPRSLGE